MTTISTGIVALDHALDGGLRMPSRVAITGPSGSGKTRLLNTLAARIRPYHAIWMLDIMSDPLPHNASFVLLDGDYATPPFFWLSSELRVRRRLLIACLRDPEPRVVSGFDVVLRLAIEGKTTRYTVCTVRGTGLRFAI